MSAARDANFAFSNVIDDHLNAATDVAHALLMMSCSELFGGDDADRRTLNTLASAIIDHQKAIHDAWGAWEDAGALRPVGDDGGRP